jgi:hypothetical protein
VDIVHVERRGGEAVKRILLTFVLAIVVLLVSISPLLAQPEGGVLIPTKEGPCANASGPLMRHQPSGVVEFKVAPEGCEVIVTPPVE